MTTYEIKDKPGLISFADDLPKIVIGGVDISNMVESYSATNNGVSLTLRPAAIEATGMGIVWVRGLSETPLDANINGLRQDCIRILESTGGIPNTTNESGAR